MPENDELGKYVEKVRQYADTFSGGDYSEAMRHIDDWGKEVGYSGAVSYQPMKEKVKVAVESKGMAFVDEEGKARVYADESQLDRLAWVKTGQYKGMDVWQGLDTKVVASSGLTPEDKALAQALGEAHHVALHHVAAVRGQDEKVPEKFITGHWDHVVMKMASDALGNYSGELSKVRSTGLEEMGKLQKDQQHKALSEAWDLHEIRRTTGKGEKLEELKLIELGQAIEIASKVGCGILFGLLTQLLTKNIIIIILAAFFGFEFVGNIVRKAVSQMFLKRRTVTFVPTTSRTPWKEAVASGSMSSLPDHLKKTTVSLEKKIF